MSKKKLWPACLPKKSYSDKRWVFGGWLDQAPFYRLSTDNLFAVEKKYLTLKDQGPCMDEMQHQHLLVGPF